MRTVVRLTSMFSLLAIAAAASAFAQPAKPGPDGWTTGSGGSAVAGGSASLQPAAASAAVPVQPALGPPGTVPTRPAVAGGGAPNPGEPNGPFLAGSLGMGPGLLMADLQLGWRIGARFSPFVSLGGAAVLADDDGAGVRFTGVGARLWFDRMFVEGRLTQATTSASCDFDDPCADHTTYLPMLGIGVTLGSRHVGLELRAEAISDGRDTGFLGTIGLGIYP